MAFLACLKGSDMKYKIEEGIEIPRRGVSTVRRDLWNEMDPGDSVLVTKKEGIRFAQAVRQNRHRTGCKGIVATRKDLTNPGMTRVWKTVAND